MEHYELLFLVVVPLLTHLYLAQIQQMVLRN